MANNRLLIDLNDVFPNNTFILVTGDPWKTLDKLINRINNAPIIDAVEVVHGRWVHTTTEDDDWGGTYHEWTCSNCNWSTGRNPGGTNYCPNCGAKMDGDKNGN